MSPEEFLKKVRANTKPGSYHNQIPYARWQDFPCANWEGYVSHNGYARVGIGKRDVRVSRAVLTCTKGSIPDGQDACHHCNNPLCVEPEHLYAGTPPENKRQSVREGRHGRRGGYAPPKLTADDVQKIAFDPRNNCVLAREYGVSCTHVIRLRKKHAPGISRRPKRIDIAALFHEAA
jgi:HNH endonuclease